MQTPADFGFFIKASNSAFDFDVSRYSSEVSCQTPHFVFFANDQNRAKIKQDSGRIEIQIGHPSMAFAKIRWNEAEKTLDVSLDTLGLQSVFFYQSEKFAVYSNRVEYLEVAMPARILDERSVLFFSIAGFLPPGWMFWKNTGRVEQHSQWNFLENRADHSGVDWSQYLQSEECTPIDMLGVLRENLERIFDEVQPSELRLSGGVDTRVVSYLWKHPIECSVVHSPWLHESEDLDVQLSKTWANTLGLPHRVLHPSIKEFHFFGKGPRRPLLTGLCGGEFLGGQFHREIPTQPRDWLVTANENLNAKTVDFLSEDPWVRAVQSDAKKWWAECARVFMQTTRSTIYNSVRGSWSDPYSLHNRCVSPFTMPDFIKTFLSISPASLGDYEFYGQVFELLGPAPRKVPLLSQMTKRFPELVPAPELGRDPKSCPPKFEFGLSNEEMSSRLARIFQLNSIEVSQAQLGHMLKDRRTRLHLIALFEWLAPRFP